MNELVDCVEWFDLFRLVCFDLSVACGRGGVQSIVARGSGELSSVVEQRLIPGESGNPGNPGGSRSMGKSWNGSMVVVCMDISISFVRR
jgi:hypothetical protein